MANLAKIGPVVNLRDGAGTSFLVVTQAAKLEYAAIIGVNTALDPDGWMWLKARLTDGTEGWTRIDLFQGLVGDFTPLGGGVYDGWTSALKVFPGSNVQNMHTAPDTPTVNVTFTVGLCACPVRPCIDLNDYLHVYAKVEHEGVDLSGDIGTAIKAGVRGTVMRAMTSAYGGDSFGDRGIALNNPTALNDWRWGYGLGNHIVLRVAWADLPAATQKALTTEKLVRKYVYVAFGHMQSLNVSQGQTVDVGTIIGYRGKSGNTNGPHVHLETRVSDTLDPANPFDDAVTTKFNPHWMYDLPTQGVTYN